MEERNETLGGMIARLRKQKGMTQLELAGKLGVTDKAVSKWERDLSCPDIGLLPSLAEVLGISIDELMQGRHAGEPGHRATVLQTLDTVCAAVALAMGVAVAVLSAMQAVQGRDAAVLLGIGLACTGICLLRGKVGQ